MIPYVTVYGWKHILARHLQPAPLQRASINSDPMKKEQPSAPNDQFNITTTKVAQRHPVARVSQYQLHPIVNGLYKIV